MPAPKLASDPLGTAHPVAQCCWCSSALVIGEWLQLRCWLCPRCYPRQIAVAIKSTYPTDAYAQSLGVPKKGTYGWHVPLPSQCGLYELDDPEPVYVLWGPRAGPGKSTGARHWLYHRALTIPGHEGLLLRENWDQLKANHTVKMAREVPLLGGRWLESDRMAVFGKGSDQGLIYCGHMADDEALTRYLGIEYDSIACDEGSLYPVTTAGIPVLAELYGRARKTGRTRDGKATYGRVVVPTNPGGPTTPWLLDMHINHTPNLELSPQLAEPGAYRPSRWRFFQALLKDNPYMREDYAQTDLAMLSAVRYQQLAEGDMRVFEGAFFPQWNERFHVRRAQWAAA